MLACCNMEDRERLSYSLAFGYAGASVSGPIALISSLAYAILETSSTFLGTVAYTVAMISTSIFLVATVLIVIGGVGLLLASYC